MTVAQYDLDQSVDPDNREYKQNRGYRVIRNDHWAILKCRGESPTHSG